MTALLRLYPRRWRQRYGAEFEQLLADLTDRSDGRAGWRVTLDVAHGALDAHIQGRYGMRRLFAVPAVRRGVFDGLILSALIAVDVVLTNVVFPAGPDESDSDPEYVWQNLATYAVIALLLVAIGARAGRSVAGRSVGERSVGERSAGRPMTRPAAGAVGGGAAGVVIAVLVTLTFVVVNNAFLSTVSQQHDKRVAFAASGWTSMRAYLTVQQLLGGLFLVVALGLVGGALGLLGAAVFRRRHPQPA
jgi:hypothetical protein